MPYPLHYLMTFSGSLTAVSGQDEIWSCGVRAFFGTEGGPDTMSNWAELDLEATIDALGPRISAWFAEATNGMAQYAHLLEVKGNVIGSDGRYADKTTTHRWGPSATVVGGATTTVPSYLSLCYSWTTAAVRGPAHHGRIYPPNYTYPLLGAGTNTTGTTSALGAARRLLDAMSATTEGLDGGQLAPAIVSPVAASWRYIDGVSIGNLWDRQARRRNNVPESRTSGPWPAP